MKKLFLIGNPVEHSISPQMQKAALKYLNLDWDYLAVQVKDEKDLAAKMSEFRDVDVAGFNVTVPFKEQVMSHIDSVDASSRIIGAVNTVKNAGGRLVGCNTDTIGFIDSIKEDARFSCKGTTCVLLGAGGASRAILFGLNYEKAKQICVYDIDKEKVSRLIKGMSKYFDNLHEITGPDTLKDAVSNADLIINATPAGMFPNVDSCPVDDDIPLGSKHVVYDLVYNPAETKLVKLARSKGSRAYNGLGMLVRQGAASLEVWTGQKSPYGIMLAAARNALGS